MEPTYPVTLQALKPNYLDPAKHAKSQGMADKIARYINRKCEDRGAGLVMVTYAEISINTGVHESTVRQTLMRQLGGSDNAVDILVPETE